VTAGELQFAATHRIKQLKVEDNATASLGTGRPLLRTTEVVMNDFTNPQGTLDVADGIVVIDYEPGSTPHSNVRSMITAGYVPAGPTHWTGRGITSRTAAANDKFAVGYAEATEVLNFAGGPTATFAGETVDDSTYLVRFTLAGDATLDGTVDFNDLVRLAQNYNSVDGNHVWSQGDFTYDGNVDFNDLVKLAQNYNQTLPPPAAAFGAAFSEDFARAMAAVPEPGTLGGLALAGAAAMLRRRRRT
jgi:hypothetical protein